MTTRIELDGGKYSICHDNGVGLVALRHGEPWRDLGGDGLVLAAAQEIEKLRSALYAIRLRVMFMGWPGESMFCVSGSNWQPDWRYECQLIEHVLHGSAIRTAEKPTDTKPRNQVVEHVRQGRCPKADANGWEVLTETEYQRSVETGHYCGEPSWTKDFELRTLEVASTYTPVPEPKP